MIIGDPYKFAIISNTIKEWNFNNSFSNGILLLCVEQTIFPHKVVVATLKGEILELKEMLKNIVTNEEIFNLPKNEAFAHMYYTTFPCDDNLDNDYSFWISPLSLSDNRCYVFAVSDGKQVRIVAAELEYSVATGGCNLDDIIVSETIIPKQELDEIIFKLNIE